MCEERKWKKDIHIQLANMKYTDSCIEILQNSVQWDKKTYMLHWMKMRNAWGLFTT